MSGSPSNEDVNLQTLFSHITGLLCAHSLNSKLITVLPGDSVSMVTHKEPFPPGMQEEGRGRKEGPGRERSGEEKEIWGGNPPYPTALICQTSAELCVLEHISP